MTEPRRAGRSGHRTAALLGLLTAFAVGVAAQPPVEDEDPKGGLKKRVRVDDDPIVKPRAATGPASPPDARLDELARAAEEATNPALKELFQKFATPFDRLTTKGQGNVRPIEHSRAAPLPTTEITILNKDGQPTGKATVDRTIVAKVEYFEELALAEANKLLAQKPFGTAPGPAGLTATDQLAAAELVLAAAVRFHDYAREHNVRRGKGWDEVRKPLADRLKAVRLLVLKDAVDRGDWPRVREAGTRLIAAYPKDPEVGAAVATARVLEARRLLASDKHFDHVKAKDLLDEFEANYPGQGGPPVKALREQLSGLALAAFTRAKDKKGVNDLTAARDALTRAAALDPTLPGVRELQRELKTGYQTLHVGVRQFPEAMSPATARLDSERQVVELVFEGLLNEVPDDTGGSRYVASAAAAAPAVAPGAREFLLRTFDAAATGRYGFESHDVIDTLKLMARRPDTWNSYPLAWFDDPTPKDNATVRVGFRQGHPDPRALLTFKLLPAQWMKGKGLAADDAGFADAPLGTGPFRLQSRTKPDAAAPRELVFVDNPLYGRWRDRAGQPFVKEVRLIEAGPGKIPDVAEAFQQGRLHILTDVPTAEVEKLRGPLAGKAQDYTAANNRRVHILALNLRRPALQSKLLRQGLSLAINREAILNDVFRAGRADVHKAMTGPFPPASWATPKGPGGQTVPLVNGDLALQRIRTYLFDQSAKAELTLLYPDDRPPLKSGDDAKGRERCEAEEACKRIKAQVEGLFKPDDPRKLAVLLEPAPTREVLQRVADEHRYDLAYVPFDYPDDWHPLALGAMLDPAAADRGGRNWFGFLAKGTSADADDTRLVQLLAELRSYREFGPLAARAAEAQKLFNASVPFVPLWQLDRHLIVANGLKIYTDDDAPVSPRALNPTTLFQGVARWRLE